MSITLTSALYILKLALDNWLWIILVIFALTLRAPYYAFKLIRRNRPLGRDIYRELAQADRFMMIWNEKDALSSNDEPYIFAFIPNQNRQVAHYSKIDEQLIKWKLIQFNSTNSRVMPMYGIYWLRNWLMCWQCWGRKHRQ